MPELVEQMYCSQQIVIPPKFPYILKRYCKAAIKTQPYDLLRWSFEYFRALSLRRAPPVKLRLEYPVYGTEGGLTRGCLKVLAHQLAGMQLVPLMALRAAWQGFCLDPAELRRVLCLCEVYKRSDSVAFLHFIAVAGGMLTKSLTNTMILLCETLTKEPDGGSANIPVSDFLVMYRFLARMDAEKDVNYLNGIREGTTVKEESIEEEESTIPTAVSRSASTMDDFWDVASDSDLVKLHLINDSVARTARLSVKLNQPVLGTIHRSPSAERATQIERDNYIRESRGKPMPKEYIEEKMQILSRTMVAENEKTAEAAATAPAIRDAQDQDEFVQIKVFDEDDNEIEPEIYGSVENEDEEENFNFTGLKADDPSEMEDSRLDQKTNLEVHLKNLHEIRESRREDLEMTFDAMGKIVSRFKSANYDLGMVAGRQMSTTSGEFIVHSIEKEIMEYIDGQIAILPDPDLKKKKARPEEVQMIRHLLEEFLDENMDQIVKDVAVEEEEEEDVPEVTVVYAVPGIGPPVDEETIEDVMEYAREASKVQCDVFMPRNIRHFLCPPLEKFEQYKYDEIPANEESDIISMKNAKEERAPIAGVVTE